MASTRSQRARKCIWYIAKLIPGVVVIGGLVYEYVVRQRDLITHSAAYWTLVGCTILFSSLCSVLESALMTISAEQFVPLFRDKTSALTRELGPKNGEDPSLEYIEASHALQEEMLLVSKASERNAPIVVLNHLLTVLLGAVLPISLNAALKHNVSVDVCTDLSWFGYPSCPYDLPGMGTESLTFFTVSLGLIVFGKIIPEKVGRKYNARIVCRCRVPIKTISVLVGWLVKPLLAISDLVLLFF